MYLIKINLFLHQLAHEAGENRSFTLLVGIARFEYIAAQCLYALLKVQRLGYQIGFLFVERSVLLAVHPLLHKEHRFPVKCTLGVVYRPVKMVLQKLVGKVFHTWLFTAVGKVSLKQHPEVFVQFQLLHRCKVLLMLKQSQEYGTHIDIRPYGNCQHLLLQALFGLIVRSVSMECFHPFRCIKELQMTGNQCFETLVKFQFGKYERCFISREASVCEQKVKQPILFIFRLCIGSVHQELAFWLLFEHSVLECELIVLYLHFLHIFKFQCFILLFQVAIVIIPEDNAVAFKEFF